MKRFLSLLAVGAISVALANDASAQSRDFGAERFLMDDGDGETITIQTPSDIGEGENPVYTFPWFAGIGSANVVLDQGTFILAGSYTFTQEVIFNTGGAPDLRINENEIHRGATPGNIAVNPGAGFFLTTNGAIDQQDATTVNEFAGNVDANLGLDVTGAPLTANANANLTGLVEINTTGAGATVIGNTTGANNSGTQINVGGTGNLQLNGIAAEVAPTTWLTMDAGNNVRTKSISTTADEGVFWNTTDGEYQLGAPESLLGATELTTNPFTQNRYVNLNGSNLSFTRNNGTETAILMNGATDQIDINTGSGNTNIGNGAGANTLNGTTIADGTGAAGNVVTITDVPAGQYGLHINNVAGTNGIKLTGANGTGIDIDPYTTGINIDAITTGINIVNATTSISADNLITTTGNINADGTATIGAADQIVIGTNPGNDIDVVDNIIHTPDAIVANGTGSFGGSIIVGGTPNELDAIDGTINTIDGLDINSNFTVDPAGTTVIDGATTINNTLTQTGAGNQVTFAGNVNANNGVDVAGANLTVGTTNFVVDVTNGNTTGAGTIDFAGTGTFGGGVGNTIVLGGSPNEIDVADGTINTLDGLNINNNFTVDPTAGNTVIDGTTTHNNSVYIQTASTVYGADLEPVALRVTAPGGTWTGEGAFGGATSTVILGEIGTRASIGGHNANLSAWAPLYINEGGSNVRVGSTTAPTRTLDVTGTFGNTGNAAIATGAGSTTNIGSPTGGNVTIAVTPAGVTELMLTGLESVAAPTDVLTINGASEVKSSPLSGMADQGIVFSGGDFLLGATDMVTNPFQVDRNVNLATHALSFTSGGTTPFAVFDATGNAIDLNPTGTGTTDIGNTGGGNVTVNSDGDITVGSLANTNNVNLAGGQVGVTTPTFNVAATTANINTGAFGNVTNINTGGSVGAVNIGSAGTTNTVRGTNDIDGNTTINDAGNFNTSINSAGTGTVVIGNAATSAMDITAADIDVLGATEINTAGGASTTIGTAGAGASTTTINVGATGELTVTGLDTDVTATEFLVVNGNNVKRRTLAGLANEGVWYNTTDNVFQLGGEDAVTVPFDVDRFVNLDDNGLSFTTNGGALSPLVIDGNAAPTIDITGTTDIVGATTINTTGTAATTIGSMATGGAVDINSAGAITIDGATTITATATGAFSAVGSTANLESTTGNVTINADGGAADIMTSGDILPTTDNAWNLGSGTQRYVGVYATPSSFHTVGTAAELGGTARDWTMGIVTAGPETGNFRIGEATAGNALVTVSPAGDMNVDGDIVVNADAGSWTIGVGALSTLEIESGHNVANFIINNDGVAPGEGTFNLFFDGAGTPSFTANAAGTNITGGITVGGTANLNGAANVGGNLDVNGTTNLDGAVTINNSITQTGTGAVNLTGPTTISNTLNVTGLSTLATVDINGGNIDGTTIGATAPADGTFDNLTADVTANFTGATTTITAGTINGTSVGATTPSTGAFTTLSSNGVTNLNVTGTAATNIGTGSNGGAVAIGNVTNTPSVNIDGQVIGIGTAGSPTTVALGNLGATTTSVQGATVNIDGGTVLNLNVGTNDPINTGTGLASFGGNVTAAGTVTAGTGAGLGDVLLGQLATNEIQALDGTLNTLSGIDAEGIGVFGSANDVVLGSGPANEIQATDGTINTNNAIVTTSTISALAAGSTFGPAVAADGEYISVNGVANNANYEVDVTGDIRATGEGSFGSLAMGGNLDMNGFDIVEVNEIQMTGANASISNTTGGADVEINDNVTVTGNITQTGGTGANLFGNNLNMQTNRITNIGTNNVNFAGSGALDMANQLIENIGAAGTDFDGAGGLTIANTGTLTSNGNSVLGNADTDQLTVTGATDINHNVNANTRINTGTSTGVASIGNVAATVNIDGATRINRSVNANTFINDGTSTGNVTIGNLASGGMINVASSATIDLDGTTRINRNTNSNTNINGGTSTGTVTIGNPASTAVNVEGPINLNSANTTGDNVTIGNTTAGAGNVAINAPAAGNVTVTGPTNVNTTGGASTTIGHTGVGAGNVTLNTAAGGVITLNGATNINATGSATTTIGNTLATVNIEGATGINTTTNDGTSIGNAASLLTLTGSSISHVGAVALGATSPLVLNGNAGTAGQVLISNGAGVVPAWTSSLTGVTMPFSQITAGTNLGQALVVGAGSSLDFTGGGTINASSLDGNTWEAPEAIGTTTPAAATFTTLTANTGASISGGLNNNAGGITGAGNVSGVGTLSGTFAGQHVIAAVGNETVINTTVTANSIIILTYVDQDTDGIVSSVVLRTVNPGASFVINHAGEIGDRVNYIIIN